VEIAVALPVLVLLTFVAIGAVNAVLTRVRCVDAARDAALAAARGESGEAAGRRHAPAGATVDVAVDGGLTHATVRVTVRPFGVPLGSFTVTADATAAVEPGVEAAGP
jgi:Flp pilus assembly protein TadG